MVALLILLACTGGASDAPSDAGAVDTGDVDSADHDTSDIPEADADADGAWTPDDCDDTDPSVFPGAPDACDGIDQDCDGEPAPAGACTGVVDLAPSTERSFVGDMESAQFWIPSHHGGSPSRFSQAYWQSTTGELVDNGIAGLLEGLPTKPAEAWAPHVVAFWWGDDSAVLGSIVDAGDFDGDGEDDLWLSAIGGCRTCEGRAFLARGPEARWPREGLPVEDGADGVWVDPESWLGFAHDVLGGEDLDGDGLADAIIWQNGGDDWSWKRLYVLPGRPEATGRFAAEDEQVIEVSPTDGRESTSTPDAWDEWADDPRLLPDLDGDGLAEVSIAADPYGLAVTSGPTLLASDAVSMEDVFTMVPWGEGVAMPLLTGAASPGDVDGDGYDELLVRSRTDDGHTFCLRWLSLGGELPGALLDTSLIAVCEDDWDGLTLSPTAIAEWDLDDDGVRDVMYRGSLVAGQGAWEEPVYGGVFPSSRIGPGTWNLEETLLPFTDSGLPAEGTTSLSDLDRNGVPELLVFWNGAEDEGETFILPDFSLPPGGSAAWEADGG